METNQLTFGSEVIDYTLAYKDRKTMGIKVKPDCTVDVIVPIESTQEIIDKKLRDKAPWILKQKREFLSYQPLTPPRKFVNGETHLYLGRQYKLKIVSSDIENVKLYQGNLVVHISNHSANYVLDQWYKQRAIIQFKKSLDRSFLLFEKFNLAKPNLVLRNLEKRWGSCTAKGKIILNIDLIKAPTGCIDYVVIHELCHLIEPNHSQAFYALQTKIMPDWQKWKNRLEMVMA